MITTTYQNQYFLTAGECDAQAAMPLTLIVSRIIETATDHANSLGIGYANLISMNLGWVLSRLTIDIVNRPGINSPYTVTTWIEGFNRLFSDRCFEMADKDGTVFCRARSLWAAIDLEKRVAADLTVLDTAPMINTERHSPVKRQERPSSPAVVTTERQYRFMFSDLDFYRHVNSVRYVETILNQWSLERYDRQEIERFEIAFNHECHYGDVVDIKSDDSDPMKSVLEITRDGVRVTAVKIFWRDKQDNSKITENINI